MSFYLGVIDSRRRWLGVDSVAGVGEVADFVVFFVDEDGVVVFLHLYHCFSWCEFLLQYYINQPRTSNIRTEHQRRLINRVHQIFLRKHVVKSIQISNL